MKNLFYIFFVILFSMLYACKNDSDSTSQDNNSKQPDKITAEDFKTNFSLLPPKETGIIFKNTLNENLQNNFVTYPYMFNGGGLAIGDINNDGLEDIYLGSNQKENKLYINKGDLKFEDFTKKAGLGDDQGWTAGITMVDINNDGYLDIYISKSASVKNPTLRKNKLFINNKGKTFTEEAEKYGIADPGFASQSYFFDADQDGDLDLYIVNHRVDFTNNTKIRSEIQRDIQPESSDQFYINNGNGTFTNQTNKAGISNKAWGLSATIGDFNNDNWLDIYVCNDFLEPDFLYINNKNGTFTESINDLFHHISFYSMGSDFADVNNDLKNDLIVMDMVSEDHVRSKRNMGAMDTDMFRTMNKIGYHYQYMSNMLQLNNGNGSFSEIGQLAGIAKTDWSWAPLFADLNNDGLVDLYITNGVKRDVTDNDYQYEVRDRTLKGESFTLDKLYKMVPSQKLSNFAFKNNGDLSFTQMVDEWGFEDKFHSNGVAYGDLDNDGDLEIVVSNIDDFVSVYENNSKGNFLKVKVEGPEKNKNGIGAKVIISIGENQQRRDVFNTRGFQSAVSPIIHFGLGSQKVLDKVEIIWPDQKRTIKTKVKANQLLTLNYKDATGPMQQETSTKTILTTMDLEKLGLKFKHQESDYDDFKLEILIPHMQSRNGPNIASADVNNDGLDDVYIGGAAGQSGAIYFQNSEGNFVDNKQLVFKSDQDSEDLGALFFDADGDQDLDLYVVSGSNEFPENDRKYQDRLYKNDGNGKFFKDIAALPKNLQSGSCVVANDIDKDGDLDLFVGGKIIPGKYPFPASSFLLENNNGKFKDITDSKAKAFKDLGLVTDAVFTDYDKDGDSDLMITGEWMPITLFENTEGSFKRKTLRDLDKTNGWWFSITAEDMDGDGDEDYVVGNLGKNNKYKASSEKPFHVYCNDFDDTGNLDIVLSKEYKDGNLVPVRGKECSSQQMPFINEKFPTYKGFANASLSDIYGKDKLEEALHYEAYAFESIYLENLGNGKFSKHKLPNVAQMGPILSTKILDINNDGHKDIIGAGNIFAAEVETIRYDASRGFVLLGDGKGEFTNLVNSGLYNGGDAKDLEIIKRGNQKPLILIANNDSKLSGFMVK